VILSNIMSQTYNQGQITEAQRLIFRKIFTIDPVSRITAEELANDPYWKNSIP